MELIIGIIIGILIGALAGIFVFGKSAFEKLNQAKIQEVNRQAELALSEAKKTAERTTNEARQKANQAKEEARRSTEEARRSTEDARRAVEEAERQSENAKKQKMLEAKEHFIQKKADFENEVGQRRQQLKEEELAFKQVEANVKQQQKIVTDKELAIEAKEAELGVVRENLNRQLEIVTQKKQALEKAHEEHISALEEVARLTQEQAKEQLLKIVRDKAESDALNIIRDSTEQAKLTAGKEAKKIVIQTIQRMAAEHTIENSVSVFNLDSDDLKGQIIGREGRNIRALEAATGAEIVVDDTPEAIVISSFDPIRREVARLALQRLVADGRIHPARIEEVVAKTRKQVDEQIMEIGERTVLELNIHALNPALVRMVGRMRFRSSYGQNLLKHSIETANLCAIMAAELGFTAKQIKMAKRAGLLHDIGKVAEEETELSHAILGMKLCEKHGEHAAISNAVGAHHDEIEMNNIISPIVQACDAISGARPGARREILESYLERIRELEKVATSYEGVQKAYAIQAGRELRVIVEAEKVPDEEAQNLSFQIANRIQNEMQYPGQIKVTVIREMRATTFAR